MSLFFHHHLLFDICGHIHIAEVVGCWFCFLIFFFFTYRLVFFSQRRRNVSGMRWGWMQVQGTLIGMKSELTSEIFVTVRLENVVNVLLMIGDAENGRIYNIYNNMYFKNWFYLFSWDSSVQHPAIHIILSCLDNDKC